MTSAELKAQGDALMKEDKKFEAYLAYEQALKLDPSSFELALLMSDYARDEVMPWHFPMMNDEDRNSRYDQALRKVIKPDSLVLDIGAGSGLLSMMAARAGAKQVVACEEVPVIAHAAQAVIKRNEYSDVVTIVPKRSDALEVGVDLPEKADVLVTEIFDEGLLGEFALDAIADARKHLLKPDAAIIPMRAEVYAMAIQSKALADLDSVGHVNGFDLSPFDRIADLRYITGHPLSDYPYIRLTEPQQIFSFDFRQDQEPREQRVSWDVIRGGVCHGITFWFRLWLDDEIFIDTGPDAPPSCWKQPFQLFRPAEHVTEGKTLDLKIRHDNAAIWFEPIK